MSDGAPARWLEPMRIADLVPALRNPKRHEIDELRKSVERFGFTSPPELDERTGRLVAGHGRVQLLMLDMEGGKSVPEGIEVDGDGIWMVYVLRGWSSADDDEAFAYLVANNRQAELGGWDERGLLPDLLSLADLPTGLDGTGWTPSQVDVLSHRLDPASPETFASIDPTAMKLEHTCPRCHYEWSGSA